jgi:hypothetical protein
VGHPRRKDEEKDPPFQKPTTKGSGTPTRKDKFKTVSASSECVTCRFYDFNMWSDAKRKEKLHYMHANPVMEGLVKRPREWPWSSFSFYAKDEPGLIRIDPVE